MGRLALMRRLGQGLVVSHDTFSLTFRIEQISRRFLKVCVEQNVAKVVLEVPLHNNYTSHVVSGDFGRIVVELFSRKSSVSLLLDAPDTVRFVRAELLRDQAA